MRNVLLFFSQEGRELSINTSARTLGELKQAQELTSGQLNNKKLTVRETSTTLESDESVLPDGDIVIFVYPIKSKAGLSALEEMEMLEGIRYLVKSAKEHHPVTEEVYGKPSNRFAQEAAKFGGPSVIDDEDEEEDEEDDDNRDF